MGTLDTPRVNWPRLGGEVSETCSTVISKSTAAASKNEFRDVWIDSEADDVNILGRDKNKKLNKRLGRNVLNVPLCKKNRFNLYKNGNC